jgi:transcriptional regulator with XRE-family HTH domain
METLRFYRRLRDVEQKDLATLLGVTTSMISRYEQGKADIRAHDLFKIAQFLSVPVHKFFEPVPHIDALIANGQETTHGRP